MLCTTKRKNDDPLIKICKKYKIKYFRGSNENVLDRVMKGIENYNHNIVVRVTGDDILIDPSYMNKAIEYLLDNNLDYVDHKMLPSGTETEVFDREILNLIYKCANDLSGTEYLTNYINDNKLLFKIGTAPVLKKHQSNSRLTIDTRKDFNYVKKFLINMNKFGKKYSYDINDIIRFYKNKKNNIVKKKVSSSKFKTSLNLNNFFKI